jgi:hypothetical protein
MRRALTPEPSSGRAAEWCNAPNTGTEREFPPSTHVNAMAADICEIEPPASAGMAFHMKNSVFSQILLAFGVVLLVFIAAIGLSVARLAQFRDAGLAITSVNLPKLDLVNDWTVRLL